MSDLTILVNALCSDENQPHQWMGDPDTLAAEIAKAAAAGERERCLGIVQGMRHAGETDLRSVIHWIVTGQEWSDDDE